MSDAGNSDQPLHPLARQWRSQFAHPDTLRTAAYVVVVVVGAWWLLGTLAFVLRPLLLAVFLGFVLLPYHARLRKVVPAPVSLALIGGVTALVLVVVTQAAYFSLLDLTTETPKLKERAGAMLRSVHVYVEAHAPWLILRDQGRPPEELVGEQVGGLARRAANEAAEAVVEAIAAGIYLLFLLLGASKLPARVRAAYPPDEAERILDVAGRINAAVISYLRAKVQSSLLLAAAAGLVLAVFGVKFALLWAVLTFLCNFVPYVGSVVAFVVPAGYAALQLDGPGKAATAAGFLLAVHILSATVVEPLLIGKAVGLSPLVVLAALSVWGSLWGLPGMVLAVPLTVVLQLVLENIEGTRPVARLMADD